MGSLAIGGGILLLIGFVRYELSKTEPLLDVHLFTEIQHLRFRIWPL